MTDTRVELLCREIARTQHGIIGRGQALATGLSAKQIERRVKRHVWTSRHRGIYVVGGAPASWEQEVWAAYLAVEGRGVVSHRAAAALWEFDGIPKKQIEITIPHGSRLTLVGVIAHRSRYLDPSQIRMRAGLRVTAPERTLIDLAGTVSIAVLEPALDSALRRRLTAIPRIHAQLEGAKGHKGAAAIRKLLLDRSPCERPSESWLESRLFGVLRELGLPPPRRQVKVFAEGRYVARIDFAYPDLKIGLEAAGYRYHGDQPGWHQDMVRRNELVLLGWRVLYFAWLDLKARRADIKRQVRHLIEEATGVQRILGAADPL